MLSMMSSSALWLPAFLYPTQGQQLFIIIFMLVTSRIRQCRYQSSTGIYFFINVRSTCTELPARISCFECTPCYFSQSIIWLYASWIVVVESRHFWANPDSLWVLVHHQSIVSRWALVDWTIIQGPGVSFLHLQSVSMQAISRMWHLSGLRPDISRSTQKREGRSKKFINDFNILELMNT